MKTWRLYIYRLLTVLLPETCCFGLKAALLRWSGARVGKHVRIGSSAVFIGTGTLVIGDDVWIGAQNYISPVEPAAISIGAHCDFGPGVMIITGSHEIDAVGEHTAGPGSAKSVEIGDGCWLGARSTILPGVALPRKTLVAAGSVVTRTVEGDGVLVAGVPAEVKRSLA